MKRRVRFISWADADKPAVLKRMTTTWRNRDMNAGTSEILRSWAISTVCFYSKPWGLRSKNIYKSKTQHSWKTLVESEKYSSGGRKFPAFQQHGKSYSTRQWKLDDDGSNPNMWWEKQKRCRHTLARPHLDHGGPFLFRPFGLHTIRTRIFIRTVDEFRPLHRLEISPMSSRIDTNP